MRSLIFKSSFLEIRGSHRAMSKDKTPEKVKSMHSCLLQTFFSVDFTTTLVKKDFWSSAFMARHNFSAERSQSQQSAFAYR
jgi:hypothetical protein